jgi:hypothetical protein
LSASDATANTLVRRDGSGNSAFGILNTSGLTVTGGTTFGEESLVQFDALEYYYGTGAASAHRIALGATTTGDALFLAATAAAARTTLGQMVATSTAQIDATAYVLGGTAVTGLQYIQMEADTLYEVSWYGRFTSNGGSGYLWLNFSSAIDDMTSAALVQLGRFHTSPANGFFQSTTALGAAFGNLGTQTNRIAQGYIRFETANATQLSVGWSQWNGGTIAGTSSLLTDLKISIRPV